MARKLLVNDKCLNNVIIQILRKFIFQTNLTEL
jgi:hypothetical protein